MNFTTVNAPTAGTNTIRVRYSNGSSATSSHSVSVNGGTGSTLTYAATTDWGTDAEVTKTVILNAGTNSIKFTHQTGFAELDSIDVYQNM